MLEIGMTFTSSTVVSQANCAATMGSGDLEVFATPAMVALMENAAMVALMENAAMNAVASALPQGSTTVGAEMNTTHIKPSAIGATVQATATLTAVDGRKLVFAVEARDEVCTIGKGTHVRFIVDKERFLAKL